MSNLTQGLKEKIDADSRLQSKRKWLIWVSLVLIIVTITGAKIEEANTFILKISFAHSEYLGLLLAVTVLILLVRYYSYAYKYHESIRKLWVEDFFQHDFILCEFNNYQLIHTGLFIDYIPNKCGDCLSEYLAGIHEFDFEKDYQSRWFILKEFVYKFHDIEDCATPPLSTTECKVSLLKKPFKNYLKVLWVEFKTRVNSYLKYPENLDIQAPYILAIFALVLFIYLDLPKLFPN